MSAHPCSLRVLVATVALIVATIPACVPEAAPEPTIAVDSAGVRIVTSDPSGSDATCSIGEEPVLVIGADEEDENQWFSSIRGMGRLSDGSIAAIDRSSAEVRIYDETGRHLRSMGRYGEGPGEFSNPFILWITADDTLWVGDYFPWRYNLFTADGDFVRRVNLTSGFVNNPDGAGVLDNGYSVNPRSQRAGRADFTDPDTLIVEVNDPGGQLVGSIDRMPGRLRGFVSEAPNLGLFPLFQSFPEVDARGSTVVLAHGRDTEIHVLDDEFALRTIIRWYEPDREVTAADVRAWREDYIESRTQPGSREWDVFDEATISGERPAADLFPAISTVMIGRDGRIWVRQYDRPREDRGWLAFGSDGRFLCHLAQLPGEVREFGADYVLLLSENELGIQTVHMYRLDHPELAESPL